MAQTVSVTVRKRGIFGKIFKALFFAFNGFMALWAFLSYRAISEMQVAGQAEQLGRAIGSTIGASAIMVIWLFGAAVLGGLVLATRGKAITTTKTIE